MSCRDCDKKLNYRNKTGLCRLHWAKDRRSFSDNMTVLEARTKYGLHEFHAKVRGLARGIYTGPKECLVCGYKLHVDICHIKEVASYQGDATLAEVNDPINLIALCRNHHWEFDNGHLSLYDGCVVQG